VSGGNLGEGPAVAVGVRDGPHELGVRRGQNRLRWAFWGEADRLIHGFSLPATGRGNSSGVPPCPPSMGAMDLASLFDPNLGVSEDERVRRPDPTGLFEIGPAPVDHAAVDGRHRADSDMKARSA
jgi:hypothetical protein